MDHPKKLLVDSGDEKGEHQKNRAAKGKRPYPMCLKEEKEEESLGEVLAYRR